MPCCGYSACVRVLAAIAFLAVVGALLAAAPGRLDAARVDYVGGERCAQCHEAQARSWKKGPHARAGESLGKQVGVRKCQSCHTTGDAPTGRPFFSSVQCEACHGSGAGYAPRDVMQNPVLARRLGLRDLSTPAARAALCVRCHRAQTRLEPFDTEAAWKRIRH